MRLHKMTLTEFRQMKNYFAAAVPLILSFHCLAQTPDSLKSDTAKSITLKDVTISSDRIIDRSSVSDLSLSNEQIHSAQGLWEDPIRAITYFPGVSKGGGDLFSSSQIYVRGGSPEENLFLLDNVKVYWPWYFGGIKSVFNNETIDRIELLTGGFSSKYGNAMSSIMNVSTRNGDLEKYHGNLSFGFSNLQSRIEGPIVKEKASFLLSARKTYLDFFIKDPVKFPVANFGDITYKIHYQVNTKNKISFSGLNSFETTTYLPSDKKPGEPGKIETGGKTNTQSLQWQSMMNNKTISKLSLTHAQSQSDVLVGRNLNFSIAGNDWSAREDVTHFISSKIKIIGGGEINQSVLRTEGNSPLNPLETDPNDSTVVLKYFDYKTDTRTTGAYTSLIGSIYRFNFNAGTRYDYAEAGNISNVSPRASVSYEITSQTALRAAYGHYYQFPGVDAVKNNNKIQSNLCTHYITGVSQSFGNRYKGWIEAYYKDYTKLVVYDSLQNFNNNGTGFSKGIELFYAKQSGMFTGWISYAYSIAKRKEPLQDRLYYFAYDQRHVLSNVLEYHLDNKEWYIPYLFSASFSFMSGTPYTPVLSAMQTPFGWQPVKGEINSKRNPEFHNLNLKVEFKFWMNEKRNIRGFAFFEIWNVYNHLNVAGRIYQYGVQYPNNLNAQEYYSTPFLMSGGFRFSF